MEKLADISSFENLCGNSSFMSSSCVFNDSSIDGYRKNATELIGNILQARRNYTRSPFVLFEEFETVTLPSTEEASDKGMELMQSGYREQNAEKLCRGTYIALQQLKKVERDLIKILEAGKILVQHNNDINSLHSVVRGKNTLRQMGIS